MATNRDLLKEAIADAKSVKATAIANAKLALSEAFTPYLKEKLSAKINEMEDDTEEMEEEVMNEVENEESTEEISLDELLAELEGNESEIEETIDEAKKDEKDSKETKPKKVKEEEMSIEDMSEDELKSFIEDVIKDMVASGELEGESEEAEEMETEEPEEMEADEAEDEDIDLEEILNEDEEVEELEEGKAIGYLKGIAKSFNMWTQPSEFLKEMDKKLKEDPSLKNDEEFMAQYDILAKISGAASFKQKPMEENSDLKDAQDTIETLQTELNEINLLNSKLLYTNKIFRNKSLSEAQKIKVLTAFDKAKSRKEAKLVYETLQESMKAPITAKSTIKESLSSASKILGTASAKPIIEDHAFARMRELAGIKK
jgi:hypothetical protein